MEVSFENEFKIFMNFMSKCVLYMHNTQVGFKRLNRILTFKGHHDNDENDGVKVLVNIKITH